MKANKDLASPILLVDDEKRFLESCIIVLRSAGINNITICQKSQDAFSLIKKNRFEAILLDIQMPVLSGKELLEKIVQEFPYIPTIMLTGADEIETAVDCMKAGAFDYMVKPVEGSRLISGLKRAIELRGLQQENSALKKYLLTGTLGHPEAFSEIVTNNQIMRSLFKYLECVAGTSRPVLITGETGVGKEHLARAVHTLSKRQGNFVPVNSGGQDDTTFSDTFFGHKKGAFTGAEDIRKGLIEQAEGGTLFLDEIGDLEQASQVKLLRLLQEGEYYPLGSDVPKTTDARIVVSTNKDLRALQKNGKFRKDLYYRLNTHKVNLIPLRERMDDLPILVEHFLQQISLALGKKKPTYPAELLILLSTYNFPGNIRELQSIICDAVCRHEGGMLCIKSFKDYIAQERGTDDRLTVKKDVNTQIGPQMGFTLPKTGRFPTLKEVENFLLTEALKQAQGNQTIAASMLGLSRPALNKRLNRQT